MFAQTNRKTRKPTAAQIKRNEARSRRIDEQITQRNIEANEQTIQALVELVAKNRRLESLIVAHYCQRTNSYIVTADEWDRKSKGGKHV